MSGLPVWYCGPIMPTLPVVLLVTLFVMNTECGEKDKVQLDDLTDGGMANLTSEAKLPLLPLNSTPRYMLLRYIPICMLHARVQRY